MVSVNRSPAGDINGRRSPCARAREFMALKLCASYASERARARARTHSPRASIPKPVNTKDKLGGCARVRGCLEGPHECFLPEFFVPGSTWVIFAQRIPGSHRVLEGARANACSPADRDGMMERRGVLR